LASAAACGSSDQSLNRKPYTYVGYIAYEMRIHQRLRMVYHTTAGKFAIIPEHSKDVEEIVYKHCTSHYHAWNDLQSMEGNDKYAFKLRRVCVAWL
jgi:hypothetical protein